MVLAMVKQKPFKVYDFKSIEASIDSGRFECVEYLKETFKKEPQKFHARWRCQKNTTEEHKARENGIVSVGRRTLEMAAMQARMVNLDPGPSVEDWKAAADLAVKARDKLWRFLNSFKPAPPHPFEGAASPEAFAEVFKMSWLKMLVQKSESEGPRQTSKPSLNKRTPMFERSLMPLSNWMALLVSLKSDTAS